MPEYDKIGSQDIEFNTEGESQETFTRRSRLDPRTTATLNKVRAAHIPFTAEAKNVEDLVDGGYDVTVKTQDMITKDPMTDVRSYGATGDGATSDTTALQNALDAGGVVIVPPGTYLHDSLTMDVADTTLILHPGASLKIQDSPTSAWSIKIAASDISIYGPGEIDGNKANVTKANMKGIRIDAGSANISNIKIDGVYVKDVNDEDGIYITGASDDATRVTKTRIENCYVTGCDRNGITVVGGSDILIANNFCIENTARQIDCEPNVPQTIERISILGNKVDGGTGGIDMGCSYSIAEGNIVLNGTTHGISAGANKNNNVIKGNIIQTCGIGIDISTNASKHHVISGNTIDDCTSYGIQTGGRNIFCNNTISDNTTAGIFCDSDDNVIIGNSFIDDDDTMSIGIDVNSKANIYIGYQFYRDITDHVDNIVATTRLQPEDYVRTETTGEHNLETKHHGWTCTNSGATGDVQYDLPVAEVGLEYTFVAHSDTHELQVDPDGNETIGSGSPDKYLILDADHESVKIKCVVAGAWEIVAYYGWGDTFEA